MKFIDKLNRMIEKNDSLLCVGLDTDESKIPKHLSEKKEGLLYFNRVVIDETSDLVCCYKLNMAFYESRGIEGINLLMETINHIPKDIPIILDGKRGDIGNTAKHYANEIFELYRADATTVNPYMGIDGIEPFLEYKDKCTFILCRTSNPSARDFQDLIVSRDNLPIYQIVARKIKEWNKIGNCGAVVGATYPEELKIVRSILGDEIPILIPGVGKQGGDLERAVRYGINSNDKNAIINSSRGIIYASSGKDFAKRIREKAMQLKESINQFR